MEPRRRFTLELLALSNHERGQPREAPRHHVCHDSVLSNSLKQKCYTRCQDA